MIKAGRPPKGYSDYENIFYLLKNELNTVFNILENNVSALEARYLKDKNEYEEKLSRYYEKTKELEKKYIEEGEEPEKANSIASGEAQVDLEMDFDLFCDEIENLAIIKNQTIDNTIKATLIAMYSLIEFNLSKIVDLFYSIKEKTNPYLRSKNMLEKKFEIIYENECENQFDNLRQIRNKIVHENSSYFFQEVKEVVALYPNCFEIEEGRFVFRKIDIIKRFKIVVHLMLISIERGIDKKINKPI